MLAVPMNQNVIVPTTLPGEQWRADKLIALLRGTAWRTRTADSRDQGRPPIFLGTDPDQRTDRNRRTLAAGPSGP